jgi:mono/diheme cytochrome c family protein
VIGQQSLLHINAQAPKPAAQKTAAQTQVERGRYLIQLGGCHDCHTPKVGADLDTKRLLSGQPANEKTPTVPKDLISPTRWGVVANNHLTTWVGPWGASYAANLTPDKQTGLGNWTADMFIAALRTGKIRGNGRPMLPPMPWQMYKDVTDADLRAMFAYLQSLPPINNLVPGPLPPEKVPR